MRIQIVVCLLVTLWVVSADVTIAQENGRSFNGPPETAKHALQRHGIGLTREALVSALRSPDAEVRELAAQVLAEDHEKDAIPSIVEALAAETVPANRVNIAFFLAQLGEEIGRTTLKRACDDFTISAWVRMLAAVNMRALHDDYCLASVVDVLQSWDDPGARKQALSLVPDFERPSEQNAQNLFSLVVKALADQTPGVRTTASNTLGRLGNVAAIPALQSALANEHDEGCRFEMQMDLQQLQNKKE
jgi:HEAT repeat protein